MIEIVVSMVISSIILTGVLTVYNQNFDLMFSSIEESDKTNTTLFIKNKIQKTIEYNSAVSVENSGNKLVLDGVTFEYTPNKLEITDGADLIVYGNIFKKDDITPIFIQPGPNWIEINYILKDRHGNRSITEKFILNQNKYDKEYFNE